MAGETRMVLGVVALLVGLFYAFIAVDSNYGLIGFVLFIVGIALLVFGYDARKAAERPHPQQTQANILEQQRLQLMAPEASGRQVPSQYSATGPYAPSQPLAIPIDRYCPSCGMGNARAAFYCQRCGKPLPPPP
jgi:hypothetical protein